MRSHAVLLLVAVLTGCSTPEAPEADPSSIALAASDVSSTARVTNETLYADAAALARDTEGWASRDLLAAWGFEGGVGRVIEDDGGTRVSNAVYLFRTDRGAEPAFQATQEPFAAEGSQWELVPARRVGNASSLWRHDEEGQAYFVLNLAAGPVAAQLLATAPGLDAERVLAWGELVAERANAA